VDISDARFPQPRSANWSVPHRMTCQPCQVAWTGDHETRCWVCGGPGSPGAPPLFVNAALT
jgi:hypothetical protein